MSYSIEQLPNKRWGIYFDLSLMASIGCRQTSFEILKRLQEREFKVLSRKVSQAKVHKKVNQAA